LHNRRASLAFSFGRLFEGVIQIEAKYLLYPFYESLKFTFWMLELSHISFLKVFSPLNIEIDPKPKVWRAALGK
jgi:hypothetical protein